MLSDAEEIQASWSDPQRFAVVFDRHFAALHRFLRRRVGKDLADDLAAETFARAFGARHRYDLVYQDARPWLFGITANLLRRHRRTERQRLLAQARMGVEAFTRDLGVLFQAYVGAQLGQLGEVQIIPEVRYDGDQRSVDWFMVWPDMVVLVEAKSTRLTQPARMGREALRADVERAIGKAFKQIERTATLVRGRHRAFSHIPADREIVGLVATLEPYFLANSPLLHQFLPALSVPTTIAAVREVERLVGIGLRRPLPPLLREVLGDPERRTWDISIALREVERDARNPLLDEAWKELPWTQQARERAGGA